MKIAFYKGRKRLFNRLVCWYCRGRFSHVELVLREEDGVSTCASSSFMDGGVRIKKIILDPEHWEVIETSADLDTALFWLDRHLGNKYDILGILGFLFRRIKQDRRKFFCNEAVGEMLGEIDPWRFDPCSYAATKGLIP